jgi:cupin 2 domain-containing protein
MNSKTEKTVREEIRTGNVFSDVPEPLPEEVFEEIAATEGCRIERIISKGHGSPGHFWYDQDQNEWVILLQGRAALRFDGMRDLVELGPGDYVKIPAHKRHRVEWTDSEQPTIWLAVHYR